ncbi:hypothetical protein [Phenylobacterium sp.]|uniref:hypothetical protein n=1 Tax=Phenylobacterium sp. TaxID=1871053 RepID=UPI0027303032|nr:hypothetical protein [Phenylobacterium sp.]MDP2215000.1 hypothetical protein [Phenylobacterium sp.]
MLKAILARQLDRFEQAWSYDASYLRRLLAANPVSVLKFSLVSGMAPRRAAPLGAVAAAEIVATLSEDCGSCVQIVVDRAMAEGLSPDVLRAILDGDLEAMGEEAAIACRFARATLDRDLEAADRHRDDILRLWGERGLAAIALALTTARLYPTLKYALGYGRTCTQVAVGDEPLVLTPRRSSL